MCASLYLEAKIGKGKRSFSAGYVRIGSTDEGVLKSSWVNLVSAEKGRGCKEKGLPDANAH